MAKLHNRYAMMMGLALGSLALWSITALAGQAGDSNLALQGYDPVAYFTMGRPVRGKPEFQFTFDETRYQFYSAENREKFHGNPEQYEPQYQGLCAMGLAAKGYKVQADPTNWVIHEGRLYVTQANFGPRVFRTAPDQWTALAEAHLAVLKDLPDGSGISWW